VAVAALLSGAATTAVMNLLRRARMRRTYFHRATALAQWASEFDGVYRQLDRLRHRSGWAVILTVRMPSRPIPTRHRSEPGGAARVWSAPLRAMLREPDLGTVFAQLLLQLHEAPAPVHPAAAPRLSAPTPRQKPVARRDPPPTEPMRPAFAPWWLGVARWRTQQAESRCRPVR
jgi:hypothetical protein